MAGERLGVLIEDADGGVHPKGRLQRVDKLVAIGIGETGNGETRSPQYSIVPNIPMECPANNPSLHLFPGHPNTRLAGYTLWIGGPTMSSWQVVLLLIGR